MKKGIGLISILTTVYNGYEFLEECAKSIVLQETGDWEWWVGINGHGVDGGEALAVAIHIQNLYGKGRIHVINMHSCRGRVESLNTLATYAKGEWVAIIDCDDIWKPSKLSRQIEYILSVSGAVDCVGTFCSYIGDLSGHVPNLQSGHITKGHLESSNPVVNSSALFRKKWAYWEDRYGLEDYDLWFRMILRGGRIHVMPDILVQHRLHSQSFFNGCSSQDAGGLRSFYSGGGAMRAETTVVSCYYPLPSKHSPEMYMEWIVQFWPISPCPLVFYTEPRLVALFQEIFKERCALTRIIGIPLTQLGAFKKLSRYVWEETWAYDPEKEIHSPELYAIWYEKKEFILRTIDANPFYSEKFVWCDAGICRRPEWVPLLELFPISSRIPSGKVLLLQIDPFTYEDIVPAEDGICGDFVRRSSVGGGIIASDIGGWQTWSKAYDAMLLRYHLAGRFIGKDQNIMASIILENRDLVVGIQRDMNLGPIYSWFSSLFFLGGLYT
jgi:teichuronic acid biosynthesis glycosyltransferase TuaG